MRVPVTCETSRAAAPARPRHLLHMPGDRARCGAPGNRSWARWYRQPLPQVRRGRGDRRLALPRLPGRRPAHRGPHLHRRRARRRRRGSTLTAAGRGAAGPRGGPPGDLYVHLRVRPDDRFVREATTWCTSSHVPMVQAALGAVISYETLDGTEDLVIPRGTQPGRTYRLRGRGVPRVDGRRTRRPAWCSWWSTPPPTWPRSRRTCCGCWRRPGRAWSPRHRPGRPLGLQEVPRRSAGLAEAKAHVFVADVAWPQARTGRPPPPGTGVAAAGGTSWSPPPTGLGGGVTCRFAGGGVGGVTTGLEIETVVEEPAADPR